MPDPKWEALAKEFMMSLRIPFGKADWESLAALLERVAGEAKPGCESCNVNTCACWSDSGFVPDPDNPSRHDWWICGQHYTESQEKLEAQLASAREEIERLKALDADDLKKLNAATLRIAGLEVAIEQAREEGCREQREKYNELLLSVGQKFQGESRHETALRPLR